MLTVGVIGANGFIGNRVVEMLHLGNLAVVRPIVHNFSGLARVARFSLDWRIADALDVGAMRLAFEGCDIIVHSVHGPLDVIVGSPRAAYKAAALAGVRRIVYLSTASVHGQDPEPGTDEHTPLSSRQPVPYNNAKVIAERNFMRARSHGKVELVTLRPGIVIGPRDDWISACARAIMNGRAYLVEGGHGICNSTYVDNLVHAIRLAFTAEVDQEAFLIVDRETITWRELYERIAIALGRPAVITTVGARHKYERDTNLIERIRSLPLMQKVLDITPSAIKAPARRRLELLIQVRQCLNDARRRAAATPWRMRAQPVVEPDLQTALLHRCRYKFPYTKASRMLGYEPLISVNEGLDRTLIFLESVGYPVLGCHGQSSAIESGLAQHPLARASTT